MNLNELTAHELHDLLVSKQASAVQIAEAVLARLEAARLVRRVAKEQGVGYEPAHEYLVDRISDWIDEESA